MQEQEIIEGNELIAEFMGAKMIVEDYYGINIIEFPDKSTKDLHGLKYHSSWDWLMPVVEKIESLGYRWKIGMSSKSPYHYCKIWSIGTIEAISPLDAIYGACIEFIKWYNSCQKEK